MSEHDDRLPMHPMLEHARDAVEMIRERTRSELGTSLLLQHALVHVIQVVGEAATRVSRAGQLAHPEIPWGEAIATRHRMVHGYDRIDYDVVWDTIIEDFPPLIAALERILTGDPR
jgi:uncharacterized protein with HEPN domain